MSMATEQEISAARAYLLQTAMPATSMQRIGAERAINSLHPSFVVKIAETVRQARAEGIDASVKSAFRPTGLKIGGYTDKRMSVHAYGGAVDFGSSIGGPKSDTAKRFYEIAIANGVYNPYGWKHDPEWNHFQMVPQRGEVIYAEHPELRETINKSGAKGGDLEKMWAALEMTAPGVSESFLAELGFTGPDAVRKYQTAKGLEIDGVAGPETNKAILADIGAIEGGAPSVDPFGVNKLQTSLAPSHTWKEDTGAGLSGQVPLQTRPGTPPAPGALASGAPSGVGLPPVPGQTALVPRGESSGAPSTSGALPLTPQAEDYLTRVVAAEARGETPEGRLAVAYTIKNRAESGLFPSDPLAVVKQRGQYANPLGKVKPADYAAANVAVRDAFTEAKPDPGKGATYFHAASVSPRWSKTFTKTAKIDKHTFYVPERGQQAATSDVPLPNLRPDPASIPRLPPGPHEALRVDLASFPSPIERAPQVSDRFWDETVPLLPQPPMPHLRPDLTGGAPMLARPPPRPQDPAPLEGLGGYFPEIADTPTLQPASSPVASDMPPMPRLRPELGSAGMVPPVPPSNPRRDSSGFMIDVNRPRLDNGDGSFSTEETITIDAGSPGIPNIVTIPTIVDGVRRSPEEAESLYRAGLNPPVQSGFESFAEADRAAQQRSGAIAGARTTAGAGMVPPEPPMRPGYDLMPPGLPRVPVERGAMLPPPASNDAMSEYFTSGMGVPPPMPEVSAGLPPVPNVPVPPLGAVVDPSLPTLGSRMPQFGGLPRPEVATAAPSITPWETRETGALNESFPAPATPTVSPTSVTSPAWGEQPLLPQSAARFPSPEERAMHLSLATPGGPLWRAVYQEALRDPPGAGSVSAPPAVQSLPHPISRPPTPPPMRYGMPMQDVPSAPSDASAVSGSVKLFPMGFPSVPADKPASLDSRAFTGQFVDLPERYTDLDHMKVTNGRYEYPYWMDEPELVQSLPHPISRPLTPPAPQALPQPFTPSHYAEREYDPITMARVTNLRAREEADRKRNEWLAVQDYARATMAGQTPETPNLLQAVTAPPSGAALPPPPADSSSFRGFDYATGAPTMAWPAANAGNAGPVSSLTRGITLPPVPSAPPPSSGGGSSWFYDKLIAPAVESFQSGFGGGSGSTPAYAAPPSFPKSDRISAPTVPSYTTVSQSPGVTSASYAPRQTSPTYSQGSGLTFAPVYVKPPPPPPNVYPASAPIGTGPIGPQFFGQRAAPSPTMFGSGLSFPSGFGAPVEVPAAEPEGFVATPVPLPPDGVPQAIGAIGRAAGPRMMPGAKPIRIVAPTIAPKRSVDSFISRLTSALGSGQKTLGFNPTGGGFNPVSGTPYFTGSSSSGRSMGGYITPSGSSWSWSRDPSYVGAQVGSHFWSPGTVSERNPIFSR